MGRLTIRSLRVLNPALLLVLLVVRYSSVISGFHAFGGTRKFPSNPRKCWQRPNNNKLISTHRGATVQVGASFDSLLLDRLAQNDTSLITLEGYLLSKRCLGKGLIFCDFQFDGYEDLCQAMLRQEYFHEDFTAIRTQLVKGTKFKVTGSAAPTRNPGNVVLLIQEARFIGFPQQLQYIQMLLQQFQEGKIALDQILFAFGKYPASDDHTLHSKLLELQASDTVDKKFLKQLARDVLKALPDDPNYPDAANQIEFSKKGNFRVPMAPRDWKNVPPSLQTHADEIIPTRIQRSVDEVVLHGDINVSSSISVTGWVQNRRRFDNNITVMSLVDDYSSLIVQDTSEAELGAQSLQQGRRLMAILHPELASRPIAGLYRNLAAVGAKVEIQGRLVIDDSAMGTGADNATSIAATAAYPRNTVFLWIDSIRLKQSSSGSVVIRHLLDLLHDRELNIKEVFDALLISSQEEANSLLTLDATQRQWKANELAIRLQDAAMASTIIGSSNISSATDRTSRKLWVDPKLLQVLERYQHWTKTHPIIATTLQEMKELLSLAEESTETRQQHNVRVPALLPLGMPGSKWQRKKRPQLAWMRQQIQQVLESHPDYGNRRLKILDIGGGKGSLAHYLGQSLQDHVQVHVVDICEGAVASGANKAKRLNLPVDFSLADASGQTLNNVTADVVVALHACGHLSDVALAHAISRNAGFVIVPCCFNSNAHLQIPVQKLGQTNEQIISVSKWLGIPSEDWSALKLLAEVQGDITLANEAIGVLCAVRAQAACDHYVVPKERAVCIKRFPIEFSTRNTVLVGSFL